MTTTNTIHEAMQNCTTKEEKKQLLKSLSIQAKEEIELGATEHETVNAVLMSWLTNSKHKEFNGFWKWKNEGFKVKKGEKGFFIWSKKRKAKDKESQDDDKEYSFFSLAYLFSNAQVEPLTAKKDA